MVNFDVRSPLPTELSQSAIFDRFLVDKTFKLALEVSQNSIWIASTTHGVFANAHERNRYSQRHHEAMANNAFKKLCHIAVNVVRNRYFWCTLCGGAWFVENLERLFPYKSWQNLDSQVSLFRSMVEFYSSAIADPQLRGASRDNWLPVDPTYFGRCVTLADRPVIDIVFDHGLIQRGGRNSNPDYYNSSPQRQELHRYIENYLWREGGSGTQAG